MGHWRSAAGRWPSTTSVCSSLGVVGGQTTPLQMDLCYESVLLQPPVNMHRHEPVLQYRPLSIYMGPFQLQCIVITASCNASPDMTLCCVALLCRGLNCFALHCMGLHLVGWAAQTVYVWPQPNFHAEPVALGKNSTTKALPKFPEVLASNALENSSKHAGTEHPSLGASLGHLWRSRFSRAEADILVQNTGIFISVMRCAWWCSATAMAAQLLGHATALSLFFLDCACLWVCSTLLTEEIRSQVPPPPPGVQRMLCPMNTFVQTVFLWDPIK